MELHELHVDQRSARLIRQHLAVGAVLPTVAGDGKGPADATRRQDNRLGAEHFKLTILPVIGKRTDAAIPILQQSEDGVLHVKFDALVDAVILQRADHFQTRAIAHMRQARVAMPSEVSLQNTAVLGAVEHRAPGLQLMHAGRSFLGVQLRHAAVVHVLAATHGVGEVDPPAIAIVHVAHCRGHAAFRHHCVGLAQKRLGDDAGLRAAGRRFDSCTQSRAARAHYQDVVLQDWIIRHV